MSLFSSVCILVVTIYTKHNYKTFFLELPYKINIELNIPKATSYHEDITINDPTKKLIVSTKGRVLCNIELKANVSASLSVLDLNDLVETLLYGKYYLQPGQSWKKIITVLTNYFTWHIFVFSSHPDAPELKLLHYYYFSDNSLYGVHNSVRAFLILLKEHFEDEK